MIWGTFTNTHFGTLILALLFIVIVYNVLVKKSRKAQILSLLALSLIPFAIVIYKAATSEDGVSNLPFDLWSLSAILMPYAVLTRQKWCCNLLLLWPIQSLVALVFNYEMANVDIISLEFWTYFGTHVLTLAIPLILFWLKLTTRDQKYIIRSLGLTAAVYTAVHIFNVAAGTNYLYSLSPEGSVVLSFFKILCPFDYWYMYLVLPIFIAYLGWWYLPEMLDRRRKTKRLRQKLKEVDEYYDEYEDEYIDEIIEEKYG